MREREREKKKRDRERDRQTDRDRQTETDRQTERQAGRQINQTDGTMPIVSVVSAPQVPREIRKATRYGD